MVVKLSNMKEYLLNQGHEKSEVDSMSITEIYDLYSMYTEDEEGN